MGIRGPQPKLKLRSEALEDHQAPAWLSKDGAEFWAKHVSQLVENKLLTNQTSDSFATLCDLWARLRAFQGQPSSRSYLDTQKAFTSLAKCFRLLPTEKPQVKEDRFTDFNEVELDV